MKTVVVEVEIDQAEKTAFGNQWKGGKTTVYLMPSFPSFWGKWESNRPIDIATAASSEGKAYVWRSSEEIILVSDMDREPKKFLQIFDINPSIGTKHLILNNFTSMKQGEAGDGTFYFRGTEWNVNWEIIDLE